jgi:hypothetical protein
MHIFILTQVHYIFILTQVHYSIELIVEDFDMLIVSRLIDIRSMFEFRWETVPTLIEIFSITEFDLFLGFLYHV